MPPHPLPILLRPEARARDPGISIPSAESIDGPGALRRNQLAMLLGFHKDFATTQR